MLPEFELILMSVAERLKMLSELEEKYAIELDREYRGYGNEIVRELLASVMIDSQKHAGLYKAAAMLAEGKSLAITKEEYEVLEKKLKLHIEKEKEMLNAVTGLMEEVKDERIKKILIKIYEDELMHQKRDHHRTRHLGHALQRPSNPRPRSRPLRRKRLRTINTPCSFIMIFLHKNV